MTDHTPKPHPSQEWATPPEPAASEARPGQTAQQSKRPRWIAAVSLVIAGALAGGGIGFAIARATDDSNGAASVAQNAAGATDQSRGGDMGEGDMISGTLTAIGASTVTVNSSKGTATYRVSEAAEIWRNGVRAKLAQLKVGDPALIQVRTVGNTQLAGGIIAGMA